MESKTINPISEDNQTDDLTSANVSEKVETTDSAQEEVTEEVIEEVKEEEKEEIDVKVEEKKPEEERVEIPEINFTLLEKSDIVVKLNQLLNGFKIQDIKIVFEQGLHEYHRKYENDFNEAKIKFIESGEKEEDFDYRDITRVQLDILEKEYRGKKHDFFKSLEGNKDDNLKLKLGIIEDLKELVNKQESITTTFNEFKALQKKWHDIGMIPQARVKELWDLYHHHVENFYDYVKINRELKELDLKKNMEMKEKLCVEAEKLMTLDSITDAAKDLQQLHEQWREIGPVLKEKKEELWQRFKAATEVVNKRNYEFFNTLKEEQYENLKKKVVLCEEVEEIASKQYEEHKVWNNVTTKVLEFQENWKQIGSTPKKDRNKIFKRFRLACDMFFDNKKKFYFEIKEINVKNLELKEALCVRAETLCDSTDWKATTDRLIALQKDWKNVGPVPRKQSDKIWGRFRKACDKFFDAKTEYYATIDDSYEGNLKLKEELIGEIEKFEHLEDVNVTLEKLKEFQNIWAKIGFVPIKSKNEIQDRYQNAINTQFENLNLDDFSKGIERFRAKINIIASGDNAEYKLLQERDKLAIKMKQSETDTATLENNIGFLNIGSKKSDLVAELEATIQKSKERLKMLRVKLKMIEDLL